MPSYELLALIPRYRGDSLVCEYYTVSMRWCGRKAIYHVVSDENGANFVCEEHANAKKMPLDDYNT